MRIVGRAIRTLEKSRTITNCAATSSVRMRDSRGDEAGFVWAGAPCPIETDAILRACELLSIDIRLDG